MRNKINKFLTLLAVVLFGFGQMWGAYSYDAEKSVPEWTVNFNSWAAADDAATKTEETVHNPRLYWNSTKWDNLGSAQDIAFDGDGFYYMYQPGTARQLPTGDALSALCYVVAKKQADYFKYNATSSTISSPETSINGLSCNSSQKTDVTYEFHMPRAGYVRLLIGTDSNGDPTGTANDSWKNVSLSGATTGTIAVTYHASGSTYDVKTKTGATTFATTTYTSAGKKLRSVEFALNSGTTTMTANPATLSNNSGTARKMYIYAVEVYLESATPATTYTVTYSAGDGSVKEGKSLPTQAAVAAGTIITLASADDLEKEGKEFDGWLCNINSTKYAAGASYTMTAAATTFTAQWKDPAPKYTVTLVPAGGTISDATGWTLNAGNYEKEVSSGTELALPTFTKANRTFKTWRKAGPADVISPITVTADVTLTAVWNATVENVIYSWEGAEGGATETGGTATGSVDGLINVAKSGYYCLQINGNTSYDKYVQITLSGEEKVKTGDKIRYTGFYTNTGTKNAAVKMRASGGTAIFTGANLPRIEEASPRTDTYVVPEGINTASVQITRHQTQTSSFLTKLQIIREVLVEEANLRTVTFNYNDGGATANKVVEVASGSKVSAEAAPTRAHYRFHEWQLGGVAYDFATAVTADITLVADWTQLYTVTYAKGEESATGDAPTQDELAAGEKFEVAANTFTYAGHDFSTWNDGLNNFDPGMEYTMGSANVTLTAQWVTASTKYAITKGSHANGDFTIDPAEQAEGQKVTLSATPNEDYLFSSWSVLKTEDDSETGISVDANGQFTMPAYAVTVNATFVADPRQKVLYLTTASTENDKLYAALKDDYNLKVQAPGSQTLTDYELVVLHESLTGSAAASGILHDVATAAVPVLNTKSYFYNSGRWTWGTPNNGKSAQKVATINDAYCNADGHPVFAGIDVTGKTVTVLTNDATGNTMQPVGSFEEGKEGYVIATTPNASSGTGAAIQEMTPAQRGAASGKYLLISVSNAGLNNLTADGQRLFKNAAAYLIDGSVHWTPVLAPSNAVVTASPSAAYASGSAIELTASADNVSAATTYTWYKGATLEAAKEAGAIQAAEIAENDGNVYSKASAELSDAGTYWCVIVKDGGACEAIASLEISVVDASYNISFVSAHGTAPSATTGVGYLLPELTESGWVHQGWTANVDVIVDAEPVTAGTLIANGKTAGFSADVVFTAVWAQEFQVSFNLNGHGMPLIGSQDVVDGELATDPGDPSEIGWIFGGWFTNAACTAGNEWDFASDVVTEDTELFAKWTAFTGCTELWPATSGAALNVGDNVDMLSGSFGANIAVVGMKTEGSSIAYDPRGLLMGGGSADVISVTLNNDMAIDTKISVTLDAKAGDRARGLYLLNGTGGAVKGGTLLGWNTPGDAVAEGTIETFSYTVEDADGLAGTNVFRLKRQNSTYIKCIKVESCGDAIIYHNLTYAVDPAAKGTVTLGATSVRQGRTTTATYSEIASGYEFDEWQISGTGASITDASANPAVITMGTTDAVVTLKLKVETPSHTVTFNKMGKGDDIAPQNVKEGAKVTEPSVTEPEGWILEGWYKESTFDNKWNFASDVMSTSNIELFANWIADPTIRLVVGGAINSTNYYTGATMSAEPVTIETVDYAYAKLGSTASNPSVNALNKLIAYNATTTRTKVMVDVYNKNTSARNVKIWGVVEGEDTYTELASIDLDNGENKRVQSEYYEFDNLDGKNRTIYIGVPSSVGDVAFLQVRVLESGTPIHMFGQVGYSISFNKGRFFGPKETDLAFEGMTYNLSSAYQALNGSSIAVSKNKSYRIDVASAVTMNVTTANAATFYVDQTTSGTAHETASTGAHSYDLTAGTWYINVAGSNLNISSIAFIAPKCAEPAFNALANSDICSGDPYVALDGTATVADLGTPTYQWYRENNTAIEGETNATYTPSADGKYYVIAVNHKAGFSDNEKKSDLVTVTTHAGTAITAELADQRGNVDDVVTLEVTATGKNVHYAWKESATIDGTYTAVAGAADAASLDVTITDGMDKYYKVVVSSDCGDDHESVAHVTQYVEVAQQNVTGSIAWNWANAASVSEIKLTSSTSPKKNEGFVMANGAATIYNNANFESDKLYLEGEYIVRDGKYFQGQTIKFNTTVAGAIRVKFSHTGNATEDKPARELYINGVATGEIRDNATAAWSGYIEVPAGEVSITAYYVDPVAKPGQQYIRVPEIEFLALTDRREAAWVAPGELGTVCLKDDAKAIGANVYELVGCNASGYMVFDQITNGEIEAGKPYLFEATRSGNVSFYKTVGANHVESVETDPEITKGMYGTFTNLYFYNTDESIYYFSGRHIWAMKDRTAEITVPAYRCYVNYDEFKTHPVSSPAPLPGRMRMTIGVNGKNTPTGVENVQGDKVQSTKVLIDGQLFILRGEKIFDATGRLVK